MKKIKIAIMLLFSIVTFSQEKLEEVKVEKTKKGIQKSLKKTTNTQVVTSKELLKAACCNLAESFETNPSIDVNFSDAFFDNYCVANSYETDDYNDQYENQDDDNYALLENNYKFSLSLD